MVTRSRLGNTHHLYHTSSLLSPLTLNTVPSDPTMPATAGWQHALRPDLPHPFEERPSSMEPVHGQLITTDTAASGWEVDLHELHAR